MTNIARGLTARQLVKALHVDGFILRRISHRIYHHPDGRRVVVAYHQLSDTFPIGTLKAVISDIGWTDQDLRRLGLTE
jgi:predicted RNA binding protein YcfA (HicA-like mRNA interferase family)